MTIRARAGRARPATADRATVRERVDTTTTHRAPTAGDAVKDRRITDIDDLRKACEDRHAIVSQTAKGLRVQGPGGVAFINANWGDPRARENAIHDVKRYAGIDVAQPAQRTALGSALLDTAVKRTARAAVAAAPPKLIVTGSTVVAEHDDGRRVPVPRRPATTTAAAPAEDLAAPADEHPPAATAEDVAALEDLLAEQSAALAAVVARCDALAAEVAELRSRPAPPALRELPAAPEPEPEPEAEPEAEPQLPPQVRAVLDAVDAMPDGLRFRTSFLAKQAEVSTATVRAVLAREVDDGRLHRHPGSDGTAVRYSRPAAAYVATG